MILTRSKYVSMLTELTILLFAVFEPLH